MAPYSNNQTSHLFASAGGWTDKVSREPGARFPAEKGRYHLYTGLFCPFAQRALILLKLKGITEDVISTSIVHWFKGCPDDQNVFPGWHFATEEEQAETPGCTLDNLYGSYWLSEIYKKSDPQYKGRFTVPVLWDKKTETIVNNESFDIMRMLSTEFDEFVPQDRRNSTYFPQSLASQITEISGWMQTHVNTGVYKAGSASDQAVYEETIQSLFDHLDKLEDVLKNASGPFLLGNGMTELDIQLYTTIIRFDPVYYGMFKCNLKSIRTGYPALHLWLRRLYHLVPAFRETTDFLHIKRNYYSNRMWNPTGVVPLGPLPDIEDLEVKDGEGWSDAGWTGFHHTVHL